MPGNVPGIFPSQCCSASRVCAPQSILRLTGRLLRALRLSASRTHLPFVPLIRTRPKLFSDRSRAAITTVLRGLLPHQAQQCQATNFTGRGSWALAPRGCRTDSIIRPHRLLPGRYNPGRTHRFKDLHNRIGLDCPGFCFLSGLRTLQRPARRRAREVSRQLSRAIAMTAQHRQSAVLAEARRGNRSIMPGSALVV